MNVNGKIKSIEIKKIIIHSNLIELEVFAGETAPINVFQYIRDINLMIVVSDHHSMEAMTVDYVFGIYNMIIIAIYEPTKWDICKGGKGRFPRADIVLTPNKENRGGWIRNMKETDQWMMQKNFIYISRLAI